MKVGKVQNMHSPIPTARRFQDMNPCTFAS
jgi:hypothetical protein